MDAKPLSQTSILHHKLKGVQEILIDGGIKILHDLVPHTSVYHDYCVSSKLHLLPACCEAGGDEVEDVLQA